MKIEELLNNVLHKIYGKEVRQSFVDAIRQCYKDATGHPESVAGVIEENKNLKQAMAKQDARINNLAKLPSGSTSGDAELADIRVGADGETYDTAGQAVREQIGSLKSDTSRIKKNLRTTYVDMNLFALGTINKDTGEEESSNKILRSIIDVNATEDITIKLPKGYQWNVAHWLAGKYRSDLWNENSWYQNLTIEKTTANYKYRILIRRSDGADITLSELIGVAETNREDLQSFDKIDDLKKKLNEVDKKVDNLSIETDTTLTKTGKAADSAVVGKEIGSLKESLGNKITKFYASNEGKNHLADSDNGKIMDMMLYGKSEQFTTTGKNLLKIKDKTQTTRGVTVTAKDGALALKGIATGTGWAIIDIDSFVLDGTCILSSNVATKTSVANKSYEQVLEQDKSKTLENAEVSKVCFNIVEGKAYDISNILIQIEKGSVATSYEPYTGGIPSPSPDYPQEIKRVVNPVVKVCGKNLLQPNLRYNDRVKINIKKGAKLTLICKNGVASKGGNLKFENANGEIAWLGMDKGSVKRQIMLKSDVVAYTYLFNSETSENYALYIGDENTYEPYKEQSIQLPITLNAIPVSSGGNVTINGQQYIADYVDVERGKVVRKIDKIILTGKENWMMGFESWTTYPHVFKADGLKENILEGNVANTKYTWHKKYANKDLNSMNAPYNKCIAISDDRFSSVNEFTNELKKQDSNGTPLIAYYITSIPQEENLSLEKIEFLKSLSTYYSVTNVTVDSEQLDGYTVFNYPISMQNGWNYVKQQLNDNRDYIYDTDLQSAEAYVNSEYAVVLTELEVM